MTRKDYDMIELNRIYNEDCYLLPDWNLSKGAKLEKAYAEYQGKNVLYEEVSP
jgi:hypothetical protein